MDIFVDTSSLIQQPDIITEHYKGDTLIIPLVVIHELDKLKTQSSSTGAAARETLRIIDSLEHTSTDGTTSTYSRGDDKGAVIIHLGFFSSPSQHIPSSMVNSDRHDIRIINTALSHAESADNDVALLTQDRAMGIIAESLGLAVKTFTPVPQGIGTGMATLNTDQWGVVSDIYSEAGQAYIPEHGIPVNNGVVIKEGNSSALGIAVDEDTIVRVREKIEPYGLTPVDAPQTVAMDLLTGGHQGRYPEEFLGALSGRSGSGKTTLAVAAGLYGIQQGVYERMMIFRPTEPVGRDLGYLPGSLDKKMEPWQGAVNDVMRGLHVKDNVDKYDEEKGHCSLSLDEVVSVESINFIRGRTLSDTFVIVDEAQNLGLTQLHTIVSRCGRGSALVLTFDPSQIDNAYLQQGRAEGVEHFLSTVLGNDAVWHVRLNTPVRGGISALVP